MPARDHGAVAGIITTLGGLGATFETAVREGFVSALGTTMLVSFGLVVLGIVLTLALIRREAETTVPKRPNVADPFSGLAPRP